MIARPNPAAAGDRISLYCGGLSPPGSGEEKPMGQALTGVAYGLILFNCTPSVQVAMPLIGLVTMTTAGWRLIMVID